MLSITREYILTNLKPFWSFYNRSPSEGLAWSPSSRCPPSCRHQKTSHLLLHWRQSHWGSDLVQGQCVCSVCPFVCMCVLLCPEHTHCCLFNVRPVLECKAADLCNEADLLWSGCGSRSGAAPDSKRQHGCLPLWRHKWGTEDHLCPHQAAGSM